MKNKVIVIGAGIGGMTSALLLASKGYDITIIEKNNTAGGRMRRIYHNECVFDAGPSLITMPFILQDFIQSLGSGKQLSDYIDLLPIHPICHYKWSDLSSIDFYTDKKSMHKALQEFSGTDSIQEFELYLAHAQKVYSATKDVFLFNPFDGFLEFFKTKNLPLLPQLPLLRFTKGFHDHNASYFSDKKLIQLFDRFATYNGSSPYKAPATLMVIPYIEWNYGGWYPKGGIYSIAETYLQLCNELGISIIYDTEVKKIHCNNGRAETVETSSGTLLKADYIISNSDVYHTRTKLLGRNSEKLPDLSSSGFVILLAMKKNPFSMKHHTVLFSDDYQREFHEIFMEEIPPQNMTVYISVSSITDASQAQGEKENWFILVNTPSNSLNMQWNNDEQHFYAEKIFKQIDKYYPEFEAYIDGEPRYISPKHFSEDFNATGGSLYGSSSNSMFSAFLRPKNRDTKIKNLFYCGGSSHPGGGIPLVILSGQFAAKAIMESKNL